jgi:phosphoglycolate phosphatase
MIGDSHNDVLTAKNAGMWSIGLTYGLAPQTLEIYPPDVLVDQPEELAAVFGVDAGVHTEDSAEVPRGEGFTS